MDSDKKQTPYDFETVDLCDFVKTIGESARQTFYKKNILFSITKDNSPILIKMDKSHMEYAIQALLDNALTYTPTGGKVDIFVSRSPASAGSGWRNKAMISVIDNGIGISPIDMPKIFTKFFRAKNAQSADVDGFGIGLHLAQSVIKKHGGKIVGYSEGENHGSRFDIFLPLAS
jgi:signal transduction histidine kinase